MPGSFQSLQTSSVVSSVNSQLGNESSSTNRTRRCNAKDMPPSEQQRQGLHLYGCGCGEPQAWQSQAYGLRHAGPRRKLFKVLHGPWLDMSEQQACFGSS